MMSHAEVKVDQPHHSRPGIFKRIASRVRSNTEQPPREPASNTWPIAKVNSNPGPRPNGDSTSSQGSLRSERNGRAPSFKNSFKAGSGNAIAQSPPATKRPSVSPTKKVHPEAKLSRDLWDEAYDTLRLDPSTSSLVVTYESIISQELPDDLKAAAHSTLSSSSGDTDHRMNLMSEIARAGLNKRRGSKTSQVEDMARTFLEQSKRIVEGQIDDFPSAALAWSGICVLTPLLLDPILRHNEFRRGMVHIVGRIPWYMHLTHLLQCPSWVDADDFEARQHEFQYRRDRAKDAVLRLYRRVLEFEMNTVCAAASAWNSVAKHTVRWQTLGKLIDEIVEADDNVREMVNEYVVETSRRKKMLERDVDLDMEAIERGEGQRDSSDLQKREANQE